MPFGLVLATSCATSDSNLCGARVERGSVALSESARSREGSPYIGAAKNHTLRFSAASDSCCSKKRYLQLRQSHRLIGIGVCWRAGASPAPPEQDKGAGSQPKCARRPAEV